VAASQVSLARGWPARAAREAGIAASLSPPSIDARIALAEAAMANQQLGDADRIAQELTAQVPEHLGVQRLTRDVKTSRRWLFAVDAEPGTSEGGGANASGEVLTLDGRLTSPPLGDHWRIFVLAGSQHAHPPEGYTDRTRAGVGLEWRSASLSAAVFPTQSWGALSKAGVGATIDWFAGDHVQLSVAAEHFAWETPLRALLQGITADDISARAAYRWHESRSVSANVSYQPFTDGNRRIAGGLQYREAFVSRPGLRVTGTGDAYASSNELTSVPYYSPPRDFSLTGGALIQHVVWRRYDHSLVQQLGGDVGLYAERGFDRNWLATLSYEHHWRFDPLTSFHYGLRWTRRVYDGAAENSLIFITGLAQRF
jgi:biofilm PGA synthesis protein PgaA